MPSNNQRRRKNPEGGTEIMEETALIMEAFGLAFLTFALVKYTLTRKKEMNAKNNMKNHDSIQKA